MAHETASDFFDPSDGGEGGPGIIINNDDGRAPEMEGWLRKAPYGNLTMFATLMLKKRYFVLRGHHLSYYHADTDYATSKLPLGTIRLTAFSTLAFVGGLDQWGLQIKIAGKENGVYVQAASKDVRLLWAAKLRAVIHVENSRASIVHEGYLSQHLTAGLKRMARPFYFVVLADRIMCLSHHYDDEAADSQDCVFFTPGSTVRKTAKNSFSFTGAGHELSLEAASEADCEAWMAILIRTIEQFSVDLHSDNHNGGGSGSGSGSSSSSAANGDAGGGAGVNSAESGDAESGKSAGVVVGGESIRGNSSSSSSGPGVGVGGGVGGEGGRVATSGTDATRPPSEKHFPLSGGSPRSRDVSRRGGAGVDSGGGGGGGGGDGGSGGGGDGDHCGVSADGSSSGGEADDGVSGDRQSRHGGGGGGGGGSSSSSTDGARAARLKAAAQKTVSRHSFKVQSNEYRLWVGSWNLGNDDPFKGMPDDELQREMAELLPRGHDIYVLGVQECASSNTFHAVERFLRLTAEGACELGGSAAKVLVLVLVLLVLLVLLVPLVLAVLVVVVAAAAGCTWMVARTPSPPRQSSH
jgi:hypothetical protein